MSRLARIAVVALALAVTACASDPPASRDRDSGAEGTDAADTADNSGIDTGDSGRATDADGSETGPAPDTAADTGDTGTDTAADTAPDGDDGPSRCQTDGETLSCSFQTEDLRPLYTTRQVHWQVPLGQPPADGWPVALIFQGAFSSAQFHWEADRGDPSGRYHRVRTIRRLLDRGFAVLTPEALASGTTYWQTNVPPYATAWETSADHQLMLDLFEAIDDGTFGELDGDQLHAAGFSSGGYMTSRMAEAYAGRFDALAVHSASWAWCSSGACLVPDAEDMPDDHPPTAFLHGGQDAIVPVQTMHDYRDELQMAGVATKTDVDSEVGHAWLESAPGTIVGWFERH